MRSAHGNVHVRESEKKAERLQEWLNNESPYISWTVSPPGLHDKGPHASLYHADGIVPILDNSTLSFRHSFPPELLDWFPMNYVVQTIKTEAANKIGRLIVGI